jgi:hypothetical protein
MAAVAVGLLAVVVLVVATAVGGVATIQAVLEALAAVILMAAELVVIGSKKCNGTLFRLCNFIKTIYTNGTAFRYTF